MSNDRIIRLLISKSGAYREGYARAVAKGDACAAKKWKEGYRLIKERIDELKQEP